MALTSRHVRPEQQRGLRRCVLAASIATATLLIPEPAPSAPGEILGWGHYVSISDDELTDLSSVAAGYYHSLGLKSDGSIVAWGFDYSGQCIVPTPNSDFVAVAAGISHSLGLKSDGSIITWGSNSQGQRIVPAPNSGFVAVAAGQYHSLGLRLDGSIAAWGDSSSGQCTVPTPNSDFVAIAGGRQHSLGVKSDGSIVVWGNNSDGQCDVPVPNTDFVAAAGGWYHSLGLKSDGSVVAWGSNSFDQCTVPAPNSGFESIGAGLGHSVGLRADGSVVAWGLNSHGEGTAPAPNTNFSVVAAGMYHNVALRLDGSVVAWGDNYHCQCTIPGPNSGFVAIAGGTWHSLGLQADGSIVAWGDNDKGQCTVPGTNGDFVAISGGYEHSLGLKSDGSIVAWGSNLRGQCSVPAPNSDYVSLAAGLRHSLGLKSNGSIVAWGDNGDGQCVVPGPNNDFVALAAGYGHSLGVRSDGSVVTWGDNAYGQCTVPTPNSDYVAVAAGQRHSLGLRSDGSIVAWGDNTVNQCNVPEPNSEFVSVAAGWRHNLGLKQDGSIVAWGEWYRGECNIPAPNSDFIAVAAGWTWSLGLKSASGAATPRLTSPANGSQVSETILFTWEPVSGGLAYQVTLAPDLSFDNPIWTTVVGGTGSTYSIGPEFQVGETLYWSVRALAEGGWSPYAPAYGIQREASGLALDTPILIAPVEGADVQLPEYFNWSVVAGADEYEIQCSAAATFDVVLWSTQTEGAAAHIPESAGPTLGVAHFWRVRALAPGVESPWSSPGSYRPVAAVALPPTPLLMSPTQGATESGDEILFEWGLVAGASSYELWLSQYPGFPSNPSATWHIPGIHETAVSLPVVPATSTVYWTVAARNAAGLGPTANAYSFTYQQPPLPLASCFIVQPAIEREIPEDGILVCQALVAGSYDGDVYLDWFIDNVVQTQTVLRMLGQGGVTQELSLPAPPVGGHTVGLTVTGPGSVVATPVPFTVEPHQFGPPAGIALVAENSFLIAGETTTLECRVVDADGALVRDDSGRMVQFNLTGEGTVDPVTASTTAGVAVTEYTAPMFPSTVIVDAASSGFADASIVLSVRVSPVERLQDEAHAYLDRLGNLTWTHFDHSIALPRSLDVAEARAFVDAATDEQRLRRLVYFLRAVDRGYYYDANGSAPGPRESFDFIPGAQGLHDATTRGIAYGAVAIFKCFTKVDEWVASHPWGAAAAKVLKSSIIMSADAALKAAVLLIPGEVDRQKVRDYWASVKVAVPAIIERHPTLGLAALLTTSEVRAEIGKHALVSRFVDPVQVYLDAVVSELSAPEWTGGDDAELPAWFDGRIANLHDSSSNFYDVMDAMIAAFGQVQWVSDLEDVLANFGGPMWLFRLGTYLNRGIEAAYLWTAGVDCFLLADDIAGPEFLGLVGFAVVQTWPIPEAPEGSPAREGLSIRKRLDRQVPSGQRIPEEIQLALLQGTQDATAAHEIALRDLESALVASDSTATVAALEAIPEARGDLFVSWDKTAGLITATSQSGLVTHDNYLAVADSLRRGDLEAVARGCDASALASEWALGDRSEGTRVLALELTRQAIDEANRHSYATTQFVFELLNTPSVPSLVPIVVVAPDSLAYGETGSIQADVWNFGGEVAHGLSATLMKDSLGVRILEPQICTIDSLAPGAVATATWDVELEPGCSSKFEAVVLRVTGAEGHGSFATLLIDVVSTSLTDVGGPAEDFAYEVRSIHPNPFRSAATFSFEIPIPEEVTLTVYDAGGRSIRTLLGRASLSPGPHRVTWDGRDASGRSVASGVYFFRLETTTRSSAGKVLRIR